MVETPASMADPIVVASRLSDLGAQFKKEDGHTANQADEEREEKHRSSILAIRVIGRCSD